MAKNHSEQRSGKPVQAAARDWSWRGTAVVLVAPSRNDLPHPEHAALENATARTLNLSLADAYGGLGVPLLCIVVVCIVVVCVVWTCWLTVLTFAPTWTANHLMGTTEYDDGDFWLIVDTPS